MNKKPGESKSERVWRCEVAASYETRIQVDSRNWKRPGSPEPAEGTQPCPLFDWS